MSTFGDPLPEDPIESIADPGPGEGSCRDLLVALRTVVDPRKRRGIRHQLVSILALAAAAVVAGARSYVAAGQWAANAPAGVLGALEVRVHPRTGRFVVPCESTIRRTLQACDGDQLDAVLDAWLYPRLDTEQVIVDGKTLRGARVGDGRAVHVLAAMLGETRTVVAQREIAHKTNEVRREAPCRIPNSVRRNSEDSSWVRWLTWSRKVMGTRACHEHRRSCSDARNDALGAPCDMAKAVLPEA